MRSARTLQKRIEALEQVANPEPATQYRLILTAEDAALYPDAVPAAGWVLKLGAAAAEQPA